MSNSMIELTPMQREHMAGLIQQLNNVRLVAENFVNYFAKENGVNLSIYQFDTERLAFVAPPFQEFEVPAESALAAAIAGNGQHEM